MEGGKALSNDFFVVTIVIFNVLVIIFIIIIIYVAVVILYSTNVSDSEPMAIVTFKIRFDYLGHFSHW